MNSNTIPHPPNASWMPPIDPNDEVSDDHNLGYFGTIIIKHRRIVQKYFITIHCFWNWTI
jgi:hypothetical protein